MTLLAIRCPVCRTESRERSDAFNGWCPVCQEHTSVPPEYCCCCSTEHTLGGPRQVMYVAGPNSWCQACDPRDTGVYPPTPPRFCPHPDAR